MRLLTYVLQDWRANKNSYKGRVLLILFRIAQLVRRSKLLFVVFLPYLIMYRVVVEWVLGVELPWNLKVGSGLTLFHGQSLVVNDNTVIGENCTLRHCTTIGNKQLSDLTFSSCPVIGDNVDIGSNVCIIGPIKIGNNVKIGAGTVVTKDVPDNSIIVGNPFKIINKVDTIKPVIVDC